MAGGKTGVLATLNSTLFHLQPNHGTGNGNGNGNGNSSTPPSKPLRSVPKRNPSWVVKTESNVNRQVRSKPDPPCVVCGGCGRVGCNRCRGRGRTNSVHLAMLPKGEWPQWCITCGGSGLDYCIRCKGSGKYTKPFGIHFIYDDDPPPRTPQPPPDNARDASSGNSSSAIS